MWIRDFSLSRPHKIFLTGLALFAASLPLSNFGMSLAQIMMLIGWIADGRHLQKLKDFFRSPIYSVWTFFYLLLLASLIHGGNMDDGLNDARVKLPFLLLPLFFSGFENRIRRADVKFILWVFSLSVLLSFLVSLSCYYHIFGIHLDPIKRNSPFISHIRLALMGVLAVVFLFSEIEINRKLSVRITCVVSSILLIIGMVKLAWFSGLFILGLILFVYGLKRLIKPDERPMERVLWLMICLSPFLLSWWIYSLNTEFFSMVSGVPKPQQEKTLNGRPYEQHPEYKFTENGYPFGDNIHWGEMKAAYFQRTGRTTAQTNRSGWQEEMVLMRYLTSRNLTKDSAGVYALSESDLRNISQGIPNFLLQDKNEFETKLYELSVELQSLKGGYSHTGHSVSMRIFAWRRALEIISDAPITGHGMSNVKRAFMISYQQDRTQIPTEQRIRAHNQFLTNFIALGLPFGFLAIFLLSWVPIYFFRDLPEVYLFYWLVPICSMFFEDTLETQAGVSMSLFAFLIWIPVRRPDLSRFINKFRMKGFEA